jgi:predicted dehydrogenase
VQVSSTHDYHAVSLIRLLLGVGFEPATVHTRRFSSQLVDPISRAGWTGNEQPATVGTTLATMDFGARSGLYDFTDNQWHNPLRRRRVIVRGSRGEIDGDDVVRLAGPRTILTAPIERRQIGYDLDLDGYDTDHLAFEGKVLWRNPFIGLRFSDEELGIASLLVAMADWVRGAGPPPYPLAQACQDHLLALAIHESLATAQTVTTPRPPWS